MKNNDKQHLENKFLKLLSGYMPLLWSSNLAISHPPKEFLSTAIKVLPLKSKTLLMVLLSFLVKITPAYI